MIPSRHMAQAIRNNALAWGDQLREASTSSLTNRWSSEYKLWEGSGRCRTLFVWFDSGLRGHRRGRRGIRLRAPERADYAARPHGGTRAETADRRSRSLGRDAVAHELPRRSSHLARYPRERRSLPLRARREALFYGPTSGPRASTGRQSAWLSTRDLKSIRCRSVRTRTSSIMAPAAS